MVVGCLSVIPLLSSASFYPLTYYAKDFVDRKDICYDFVVNHDYAVGCFINDTLQKKKDAIPVRTPHGCI